MSEEKAPAPAATDATAAPAPPPVDPAVVEAKFKLVRSVGEECIADEELKNLLAKKPDVRCYDGFEPSGRLHIAQGLFKAVNVNKCTQAGCTFIFWVADWFALMNDKMGGDLAKIRAVGEYLIEVWTAAGMDMSKVEFRWSSDDINQNAKDYWKRTLDIGRRNTLNRIKKCCQIMGRTEGKLTAAQILYPLMQCTDIFFLKADICQLGVDQRKVNMLAREYCDLIGKKLKPVILSHHMLAGLLEGQQKMSKSNPDSAIFMEDTPEDVARKIGQAYCPRVKQQAEAINEDGEIAANKDKNPVLEYLEFIIFTQESQIPFKAGGRSFDTYAAVEEAFLGGDLSEKDMKDGLVAALNSLLDPIRTHFASSEKARKLLEQIREWRKDGATPAVPAAAPAAANGGPSAIAWIPCLIKVPLNTVANLAREIEKFQGGKMTVIVPDWAAFASNDLNGDEKGIDNVLEYNLGIFKSQFNKSVTFVKQSELILKDPSSYWINAIAAGRKLDLGAVEASRNVTNAGQVIASLMRVADAAAVGATAVLDNGHDENVNDVVVQYFGESVVSRVRVGPEVYPALCDPKVAPTSADFFYADDTDKDLQKKIKSAFCAPQDPATSMIVLAQMYCAKDGAFTVSRKPDLGGDKDFKDPAEIVTDYTSGALHPGDLKAAVTKCVLKDTESQRKFLASPEMTKLATGVKNAEKKLAKAK